MGNIGDQTKEKKKKKKKKKKKYDQIGRVKYLILSICSI